MVSPETYFFKVWLPEMIGYAEMVVHEKDLREAWINGDRSRTSAYYPGELLDQVDDLSEGVRQDIGEWLSEQPALVEALQGFLHGLELLWFWAEANLDTKTWGSGRLIADADAIFRSHQWQQLREKAREVVILANAAGFSRGDWSALD